jgi:hypothetical protein
VAILRDAVLSHGSSDCMSLPCERRLTLDAVARVARDRPGRASSKEGES